jgi:methyltransferase (TIGR00027 family)
VPESLRRPSRTAVLTAVVRALPREEPAPVIFDDTLALGLAGDEGRTLIVRLRTEIAPVHLLAFSRWVCIRSRYAEDLVERAVRRRIDQYVVLGAGLDSFAYRRADLQDRVRVFEVDHPGSQAWKRRRLLELEITIPDNLVFAPVDFEHQTLRHGLESAGFDFSRPAVFSWIGVTMYLTLDAIEATLATIAQCPPGTRIVFTYNQPLDAVDELSAAVSSTFMESFATKWNEPFISFFMPAQIEELLGRHGFDHIEHFGPDEARGVYFDGRDDVEIAGAQRLVTANVSRQGR